MRVLVFHGYLLHGTGSNVYNARLVPALVALGHEVHLLCQDREPEDLPFVDAVGDWDGGALAVRTLREPVRCTVYRPDIGGVLPVYVPDRYAGIDARPFPDLSDAELDAYLAANVAAVGDVAARAAPEVALANHLVMGPVVLARALDGVPYAVKIHGSALEYVVKPHPRFLPYAREGLAGARGVLVGSNHTAKSLWAAMGDAGLPARTRLGPPGVDVEAFRPRPGAEARSAARALAARMADASASRGAPGTSFERDPGAGAAAIVRMTADPEDRVVGYVGKLIVSKGVDLLLAAFPLVLAAEPRARLAIVGFGGFGEGLERLLAALAAGDLDAAAALARRGRALEGGPEDTLRHLLAFLKGLPGAERERYVAAAAALLDRVDLVGRLDHDELAELLPLWEAEVVPSTFPEAFGMVAAEAAACGVLPLSAAHSGLAEVTEALAAAAPPEAREWLAFDVDDRAVPAIAERLIAWLRAPEGLREATRAALRATAAERWSWQGVARGVIAAATALPRRGLG
jgi:glycosyltransferase involved in cell wall biosynthesis